MLAWLVINRSNVTENLHRQCDRLLARLIYREAPANDGRTLDNVLSLAGFVLLAIGFWKITKTTPFPGAWAELPVAGAFLLIAAGQRAWLNRVVLGNRVAVFFGLISFPLYLWHWPLLSFARIIEGGTPARGVRIAAVLTAIVLAWLTWRFIERPLRFGGHGKVKAIALVVTVAILGCAGYITYRMDGFPERAAHQPFRIAQPDWIMENLVRRDAFCEQLFLTDGIQPNMCRLTPNQPDPAIVLIGDSMAWHFFHGLNKFAQQYDIGVLALNQAGCSATLFGFATHGDELRRDLCEYTANKSLEVALNKPSVKTVIFAHAPHLYWPNPETRFLHGQLSEHNDAAYTRYIQENMRRTFSALLAKGKHVVYITNNLRFSFNPRTDCIARRFRPPTQAVCAEPREEWLTNGDARLRAAIDGVLAEFPQVRRFDLASAICDEERCWAMKDGKLIYRDAGHLSNDGSDFVAERLWPEMVIR